MRVSMVSVPLHFYLFFFFCNITMILSATCNALREVITPKIVPRLCRFKSDLAFHGEVSVVLSWNKRLGCALKRGENILHGNYTNCFTCKISHVRRRRSISPER